MPNSVSVDTPQRTAKLRELEDLMIARGDQFRANKGHASTWTDADWDAYNHINNALGIIRNLLGEDDDDDLTCEDSN